MAVVHHTDWRARRQDDSDRLAELVAARRNGDGCRSRAAEEAVITGYLTLASSVARRYRHRGVDYDDLEQVARIGLVKAVRRWRPERGAFLAYAKPTIEGEVKRHFRDGASTIRVPRQLYEAQPRVTAAQRALRQELSREPTADEIAERTGIPAEQVREIQRAAGVCQPLSSDDGAEPFEGFASQDADRDLSMVMLRTSLRPALAALPERERHIIALRFVWCQSQSQIAHSMGISQMQVSRVLRAALAKLREQAEATDNLAR